MLKQRIVTALALGAAIVWVVLALPASALAWVLLVVVLLGAREWARLVSLSPLGQLAYCLAIALLIGWLWERTREPYWFWPVLCLAALYWVAVVVWLGRYSAQPQRRDSLILLQLAGIIVLVSPWVALLVLRTDPQFGAGYVLFLLVLIWLADSGAYFAGRAWGKRKLAPSISPGKTRVGALAALATTALVALFGASVFGLQPARWPVFVIICLVTVVFSIVGDLFESMIKRQRGVKDSGALLPGHGGVLDRVDSLTAAAPLFVLGLLMLVK